MFTKKIVHYYPDAQWNWISENDFSTLEWFGPGQKPSEEELNALPWPPAPTFEQLVDAVDAHIESIAKSMEYKSSAQCAGYVASTVPRWAAEASAFIAWRDMVWLAAYNMDPKILPSNVEELLTSLPIFQRPEV